MADTTSDAPRDRDAGAPEAPDGQGPDAPPPPGDRLDWLRLAGLAAGPLVCLAVLVPPPAAMPPEAWRMVAVAGWMVVWWLSEAVPIPATALLPLVLMPLFGIQDAGATAARYGHPLIFLFLGGFLLAAAMQRVRLHRRIALHIVAWIGTTPDRIVLGFMLATAFLSMWISNTATAIMMFAVGLSVIGFVADNTADAAASRRFGIALMLSIAYAASIGGVGTLIGTPPNALLASFLQSTYGIEISFFRWMLIGLPIVVVMLPAAWLLLTRVLFPADAIRVESPEAVVHGQLAALGRMSRAERLVGIVFLATATLWVLRTPLAAWSGLPLDDTMIAIAAALVLFAVPVSRRGDGFALDWEAARGLPWGVLLLFGGGLALAEGFAATGLAAWIGGRVAGFEVGPALLVLVVLAAMVYLTEITSNTASTATFLPIVGAIAVGLGLDPVVLAVPVALGASMAFMMPVATPPNAIVFSYEEMTLRDMVRAGFWLNVMAIAVAFAAFMLLGPRVFDVAL
ncbi:DASS family sodium-coupled anion symporter [Aquibium sp. A9E412]|uniref:SLC13 family permease n=1 Tax=Aquibium sp. A9E412 TaxID=2976767 RepID=UPI0025B190A7|nr:DASS family sodium-coupled anion symporter [Aquibium sp. A9E412]MDN2566328.1 DASS family sodium-coupled anion symporter [Aquibium sp. A9E412]